MRTTEEVIARIQETLKTDIFGFKASALLELLTFEQAKPFLKEDASPEGWKTCATRDQLLGCMREYMAFAWGKVEDHRGLSAGRSVEKFEAWIWALGDDATLAEFEAAPYAQYGAPQLAVACRAYGFPIPETESVHRMILGEPCERHCESGCSR